MNVSWLKDGVPLSITENRFSISEMRVGTTRTSKVILLKPFLTDSGLYTCILSSTFGKQRKNIQVKIVEPPSGIKNIQFNVNGSNWKLRWENADASSKTSWYMVQYKNESDAQFVFRIYGVNEVGKGAQKEFRYSAPAKQSGIMMLDSPVMSHSNQSAPKVPLLLIVVPVITAILALLLILIVVYIIRRKEENKSKTVSPDDQFTLRSIGVKESDNLEHRQSKYSASEQSHSRYGTLHRNDYYSNSSEYITPYATFPPQELKMAIDSSKIPYATSPPAVDVSQAKVA
ncbi:hypothetical protein GQR58_024522 [Nymphon striatum]|nr:hypothetical protein GQR58_024522 [Nymphon striatum]